MTALVWRSTLNAQDIADVFGLLDAVTAKDGAAPLSEQVLMHLRAGGSPRARHLLARAEDPTAKSDGRLLGYGQLDLGEPGRKSSEATSELVVHPDARKHGLGIKLLEALMQRAGGKRLHLWSHGEHPGAVRLATRLGFKQVRTLWQMRRSLVDIPLGGPGTGSTDTDTGADVMPEGVRLRPFEAGRDEAEFLRVNNAAFDWHPEQGGWTTAQLEQRQDEPWWDPEGFLLAVEDAPDVPGGERVLGYHWTKVHEATKHDAAIGEVYVLGVDPAARGRRLGAILTVAGLRYLRELGLSDVMLYVEADNAAAVRVYKELGFVKFSTDVMFVH